VTQWRVGGATVESWRSNCGESEEQLYKKKQPEIKSVITIKARIMPDTQGKKRKTTHPTICSSTCFQQTYSAPGLPGHGHHSH